MSYSQFFHIDPGAIAAAMQTIHALMIKDGLQPSSLDQAMTWLEVRLPKLQDEIDCLVWANACEQCAALPETAPLWQKALRAEGYTLRLMARDSPCNTVN